MNSRILLAAGGACLLLAAGGLYLQGKKGDSPVASRDTPPPAAKTEAKREPLSSQTEAPAPPVQPAEKLSDEQRKVILGKIEEASVTYDPQGLPLIEPYLLHPDPEVRTAALNGMIILGESGAAPMLRTAAKNAPTPKEAVALTEAADYLELPSGSFVPEERTAAGARLPNSGKDSERSRPRLQPRRAATASPDPR